jgi:amino acid transporter
MSSTTSSPDVAPKIATPRPALSVFDAVMIITGIVIGGGIFAFPPIIAGIAGSAQWMFIAWILGAVLSLIGALCYAELASTFPSAGGDYDFLTRAYGKDLSFFFAWARATVILPGPIALLSYVVGDYLTRVVSLGTYSSAIYAALCVIVLTAVNIVGLRDSARTQNVMTILLVIGMFVLALAGTFVPGATAGGAAPPFDSKVPAALGSALLFVLFTFSGWNEAAYVSAEVRGGSRSLASALVISIGVVTLVYLLFVWGLLAGLGFDALKASKAPAADVANQAFGPFGEKIVGVTVSLAALTSINATMLVGARTNYTFANHWSIVRFMGQWDSVRGVPVVAFLVQGVISLALVLIAAKEESGVRTMVDFTSPVFWFFITLTGVAVIVLRFKFAHVPRPFKVPLYPIVPLVFIATCAYLLYSAITYAQSQKAVYVSFYVMAAGVVAWIIARLKRGT